MKIYGLLAFLLIHVFFYPPQSTTTAIAKSYSGQNDKQALLAFKENLDNDALVLTSWNESSSHCKWEGVFCCHRHAQRVCELNLSSNGLVGSISPYIGNLTFLRILRLTSNELYGTIPLTIGHLSRLEILRLGSNSLSGTFPAILYNFSNLVQLSLAFNQFYGNLPYWLGHFPRLEILYIGENNFTGNIPLSITNLSSLQAIELADNYLGGPIPEKVGKHCPNFFSVGANKLEAKDAADWKFIDFFANCSNLELFALASNKLGGLLPSSIANLTSHLELLDLGSNYISGEIPSGIKNLVGLIYASFQGNYLTGTIPADIGKLHNLNELLLGMNNFSGPIPPSIGNLTSLTLFTAESNHLVGSIPLSIGNLTQLTLLVLNNNALSGIVPKSLFRISTLSRTLDLSYNYFSGTIPDEVSNLKNLVQLVLSGNNLSGNLPEGLESCQILTYLALDGNTFQGTIPSFLGNLKGLQYLNLSNNDFLGSIPEGLGLINDLRELYLARNKLSGNIPLVLENLTHLSVLDISYNNISGPVPEKGVFNNVSALMLVGNDMLCGGIPKLHLPKCLIPHGRKHSSKLLKFGIPIISIILMLTIFSLLYLIHKWKKNIIRKSTMSYVLGDMYSKVSYGELAKATENFASSNLIGVGKYGRVYKGILQFNNEGTLDEETHHVAVKVFDPQQLGSSKSFLAECETLKIVRHRNLIRIRTCCSTIDYNGNDFKALVFDYIPNGDLHSWLHPETNEQVPVSPLGLTQRLSIAIDVADALDYLHHNCHPSVIHCDLKPSNILLCEDFSACIGDFGLAKLLPDPISKTILEFESSIGIRGSIGYVPPEYGEGCPVSAAGDAYSFGVLLLEMFTGRNPTKHMFINGLTLHNFVGMAFPERVMDIIDPYLVTNVMKSNVLNKMSESLMYIIEIGLTCSKQSPTDRMSMEDAAIKLHKIRDEYFACGNL